MKVKEKFTFEFKKIKRGFLNIGIVYPGSYCEAASSLGFMMLFRYLLKFPSVSVDRFFTKDIEFYNKEPVSFWYKKHVQDFDILFFTIPFELQYIEILKFIKIANLEFFGYKRGKFDPVLIAGGVSVTSNPLPLSLVMDGIFRGDFEYFYKKHVPLILRISERAKIKEHLHTSGDFTLWLTPNKVYQSKIYESDFELSDFPAYSAYLTENAVFKNTILLEITRGCPHRCKFCLISYLKKFKFLKYDMFLKLLERFKCFTNKLGLIASNITDYPYIEKLIKDVKDFRLLVTSLRADNLRTDLLEVLKKSGQRNLTISIDGISERIRKKLNKKIKEKDLIKAVELISKSGFSSLKLYTIFGFEEENEGDYKEFIDLCENFVKIKGNLRLKLVVNYFINKLNTPYFNKKQKLFSDLKNCKSFLESKFRKLNLSYEINLSRHDILQKLFSIGNEKIFQTPMEFIKLNWSKVKNKYLTSELQVKQEFLNSLISSSN